MPNYNFVQLVNDPTFAQSFTIQRDAGAWVAGSWVPIRSNVAMYGIIQPANEEELQMVPEGDRIGGGTMTFHSSQAMYETHTNNGTSELSDIVNWNGQTYKLIRVWPWQDFGYYRALGVRMSGE